MKSVYLSTCIILVLWVAAGCERCKNCKVRDEDRFITRFEIAYGTIKRKGLDSLPDTNWWRNPITRPFSKQDTVIKEGMQEYCGRELSFVDSAKNKKVTAISNQTNFYLSRIFLRNDTLIRYNGDRISLRTIDCN